MESTPVIRPIEARDDAAVAAVIREVMPEFGAVGKGFAIEDEEVDRMSVAYSEPRSRYFVVEVGERVLGGGGVAPLAGGDTTVCELRKMYFLPGIRGRGLGRDMLARCLAAARELGFRTCYLETLERMDRARDLYRRAGFYPVQGPLGHTGHHGCDRYYVLGLDPEAPSAEATPTGGACS